MRVGLHALSCRNWGMRIRRHMRSDVVEMTPAENLENVRRSRAIHREKQLNARVPRPEAFILEDTPKSVGIRRAVGHDYRTVVDRKPGDSDKQHPACDPGWQQRWRRQGVQPRRRRRSGSCVPHQQLAEPADDALNRHGAEGAHAQTSATIEELEVSPSRNGFTITIEDTPASAAPGQGRPPTTPSEQEYSGRETPPRKIGTLAAHITSAPGRTHAR